MRSHSDSLSPQSSKNRETRAATIGIRRDWRWESPRLTPTEVRHTPNMSRSVTPYPHGIPSPKDGSPSPEPSHAQAQGDDGAIAFHETHRKLDDMLRTAGYPPNQSGTPGSTVKSEGQDETKPANQPTQEQPMHEQPMYEQFTQDQLTQEEYVQPQSIFEYRQAAAFHPRHFETPFVPAVMTWPSANTAMQPWSPGTLTVFSPQGFPPAQPTYTNPGPNQYQPLPLLDPHVPPTHTAAGQHRVQQSLGALNLGESAPAYLIPGRPERAATLPGHFGALEHYLQPISQGTGSFEASSAATITPDNVAGKHQAAYRNQPPESPKHVPAKPSSDNMSQPNWHQNTGQPPYVPPFRPQAASFHATPHATPFQPAPQAAPLPPAKREKWPLNTRPNEFRPMQAVVDPTFREHLNRELAAASAEDAGARGKFSARYFGMHTEGNASAEHISPEQNCALWLRNLPPDITHAELLKAIRNVGRIWCTYINQPDFINHSTAAAKVAFFTAAAARKFLRYVDNYGPLIRGRRIKADYNRIKYPEKTLVSNLTRVLIITGASWFVNPENLCQYFSQLFTFQVDEIITLVELDGRSVVEFRFGSYRCQAQMGKMALERQKPDGLEFVEFGDDPCEMGETFSSYRVAADRISKKYLTNA